MSSLAAQLRRPRRKATVALCAAALGTCIAIGGGTAAPAIAASSSSPTAVILGVGANERQRIVSWYSADDTRQSVQVAAVSGKALTDAKKGRFPVRFATFSASGTANIASSGGYNRHATITGLKPNATYFYRVGSAGHWSPISSFTTQRFTGGFDFLFFGDPQIGASGDVAKDAAGWRDTLRVSTAANPKAELFVSGGDQVEDADDEAQWDAFLSSDTLRKYPFGATIGNHDVGGKAYEQHLYTPNTDRAERFYRGGDPAADESGGDYWYLYKGVLFIDLNSNSYKSDPNGSGGDTAHVQYVTDVIKAQGAKAKHTVLVYHHSIYSPADHAQDADNKQRRVDFPRTFSSLGVDLVLQGHDHSYSRSYEIKNSAKARAAEKPGQADVTSGPGGVIYVTANSASGSKYYDITTPVAGDKTYGPGNGADPLKPSDYWYNSVQSQEYVRSYVTVQVRDDRLVVQDVRSGTCAAPNAAVELGNSACSGAPGEVGSVVDKVTIHLDRAKKAKAASASSSSVGFGWGSTGAQVVSEAGATRTVTALRG